MLARIWTAQNRIEFMRALVIALFAAAVLTACTTAEKTATRTGDGAFEGQSLNEIRSERRERLIYGDRL